MSELLSKEKIETMLTKSGLTPDENFIVVNRMMHPKFHKIARLLDGTRGMDGVGPFQGLAEAATILIFTPEAIYFTIMPSSAEAAAGNFCSHMMVLHGFLADFSCNNLQRLAANGFYGRVDSIGL